MDGQAVERVREVYDVSYRRLVGQLAGVTGDPSEAEDVVMEAFAKAVRSAGEFARLDNPEAWLRTVAVNAARSRWRRRRWSRESAPAPDLSATSYADLGPDRLDLLAALRALPSGQREVIGLHHLADLPEEVASRTTQPPFEAVVTRVRVDRRRALRRTAAGAAGLAAAAALVVPWIGDDPSDRQPSDPAAPTVSELLARPQASVVQISGNDDGGVAALWQGCDADGADCGYAVLTSSGRGVAVDSPVLSPTHGGWLIHTPGGWEELASDGGASEVTTAGEDGVHPGDEAVETAGGLGLLRGDRLHLMPSASGSVTQAYVTPEGRLLEITATGDGSERLRASTDGTHWTTLRTWESGAGVAQVRLAGRGQTVAAVTTGGSPSGDRVIEQVDLSHDGGRTWSRARGIDFVDQVRDLSGLAVSPHGTVYLTTGSDGLIRVDAEGNAQRTPVSPHDQAVFTTTYVVCVLAGGWGDDRLQCSEDDGSSWHEQTVPGRSLLSGG